MSPTPSAVDHAEARARIAAAASRAARQIWRDIDRDNLHASWLTLLARVLAVVTGGQLAAAQAAEPWLELLLGDDPERPQSDRLDPSSLVGVDGSGRPLAGVLMAPVWSALRMVTAGAPVIDAMARGQLLLDLVVRTAVADTGRAADSVAMISRPSVTSYIRVVEGGACDRCLVLAGREYGVSTGFQRHPRCHCGMEPVTREHQPKPASPQQLFDSMTEAQRRRTFGDAGAQAIQAGADIAAVVNARRGMATATAFGRRLETTTEGTVRGDFRRREFRRLKERGVIPQSQSIRGFRPGRPRLMPEEIFRQADDRAHAVRLLRQYGYLF